MTACRLVAPVFAASALITFFSGCSDSGGGLNLARVQGKVLYKGAPVSGANVQFATSEGQLATGMTDSQGQFTLTTAGRPGAVVGEHQVTITKYSGPPTAGKDATQLTPQDMMEMQKQGAGGPASTEPQNELPERYAQSATSGLTATVGENEAENVFEFPLVD